VLTVSPWHGRYHGWCWSQFKCGKPKAVGLCVCVCVRACVAFCSSVKGRQDAYCTVLEEVLLLYQKN
jgi:hypothetical protein